MIWLFGLEVLVIALGLFLSGYADQPRFNLSRQEICGTVMFWGGVVVLVTTIYVNIRWFK